MNISNRLKTLVAVCAVAVLSACAEDGSSGSDGGSSGNPASGQRGSTARMALVDKYLYAIADDTIQLFDLDNGDRPLASSLVQLEQGIETLFPYQNYLLVGGANGVYILDNTDPANPVRIGEFVHATADDPVVAKDDLAYVTLRNAQTGNGPRNRLDVVDISDPTNPQLIYTVEMEAPRGLTVDRSQLHVCDGDGGIKTFSLDNPREPSLQYRLPNDRCTDVLMVNDLMVTVGEDGVGQYDVTMGRPFLISRIPLEPNL